MSIMIQKGNFYNHITKKIDSYILDSNEYDLKLTTEVSTSFYRIRFSNSAFQAKEIEPPSHFYISPYPRQVSISQLSTFQSTDYYHKEFPYRNLLDTIHSKEKSDSHYEDYYEYLLKVLGKKSLSSEVIYDFVIPCLPQTPGVRAYQLSIELVRKKYYVIFIKELVEKGYRQHSKNLYCIYERKFFSQEKKEMEDAILTLCLENDYPITLTTFLFTICNQNIILLKEIMNTILLARNKRERNLLLANQIYSIISPSIHYDPLLESEIEKYICQKSDDISYEFKKKRDFR